MPLEAILGMYQAILPSADSLIKCLVIFNLPFTLVKGLLDAVLCMVIYKPVSHPAWPEVIKRKTSQSKPLALPERFIFFFIAVLPYRATCLLQVE